MTPILLGVYLIWESDGSTLYSATSVLPITLTGKSEDH